MGFKNVKKIRQYSVQGFGKKIILSAILFTIFFILVQSSGFAQSGAEETRGIFIRPFAQPADHWGPDKIGKPYNLKTVTSEIEQIENVLGIDINAVYINFRSGNFGGGDFYDFLYYNETQYPSIVIEVAKRDDFLKTSINEFHRKEINIKVHAWITLFNDNALLENPQLIGKTRAEIEIPGCGSFVNPADPKVREFELNIIKEIAANYDVDGINLDYVRYEEAKTKDYPNCNPAVDKTVITSFVNDVKNELTKIEKQKGRSIVLSADLFPETRWDAPKVGQDKVALASPLDVEIPMTYDSASNSNSLSWISSEVSRHKSACGSSCTVVPALQAFGLELQPGETAMEKIKKDIIAVKKAGSNGYILFVYGRKERSQDPLSIMNYVDDLKLVVPDSSNGIVENGKTWKTPMYVGHGKSNVRVELNWVTGDNLELELKSPNGFVYSKTSTGTKFSYEGPRPQKIIVHDLDDSEKNGIWEVSVKGTSVTSGNFARFSVKTDIAPGAVDFSQAGISVSGLDLNYVSACSATGDLNLVFKGKKVGDGETSIDSKKESEQIRKDFLSGLAVPNHKQWISLPIGGVDIEPIFAETQVSRDMLDADVKMKFSDKSVLHDMLVDNNKYWESLLRESSYSDVRALQGGCRQMPDGVTMCISPRYPNWVFRTAIIPGSVVANASGCEVFIVNSTLGVESELMSATISTSGLSLSSDAQTDLNARLDAWKKYFQQSLTNKHIPAVKEAVNTLPEYATVRQSYKTLALAQWYKNLDRKKIPFGALIDSENLGGTKADAPFDTNYWASKSNQFILSVPEYNFEVWGGVAFRNIQADVKGPLSNETKALADTAIANTYSRDGDNYYFGGTVSTNDPDLIPVAIWFPAETMNANEDVEINTIIKNKGMTSADSFNVKVFDRYTSLNGYTSSLKIAEENVTALDPDSTKQLIFKWNPGKKLGAHNISVIVDATNSVEESLELNNAISATLFVSTPFPTAIINLPLVEQSFTYGDKIMFSGSGTDLQDGDLSGANLVWTSNIDGQIGVGNEFTKSELSHGAHIITLNVTDKDGFSDSKQVGIVINPAKPVATIISPNDGGVFLQNESIKFEGYATDVEDGNLSGNSLSWVSNLDGQIGTGKILMKKLSAGLHTITLTAVDSEGLISKKILNIVVSPPKAHIINKLSDGSTEQIFGSINSWNKTVYLEVPKNANITLAKLDVASIGSVTQNIIKNSEFNENMSFWDVLYRTTQSIGGRTYPEIYVIDSKQKGNPYLAVDAPISSVGVVGQKVTLPAQDNIKLEFKVFGHYDPTSVTVKFGSNTIDNFIAPRIERGEQPIVKIYDLSNFSGQTGYVAFNVTSSYWAGTFANFDHINITSGLLVNPAIDLLDDKVKDWSVDGTFSGKKVVILDQKLLNNYLTSCTPNKNNKCSVPLRFYADSGKLNISNIVVQYEDSIPPKINFASYNTKESTPGFIIALKANVTDNIGVSEVTATIENITTTNLTFNKSSGLYEGMLSVPSTGTYITNLIARDTSDLTSNMLFKIDLWGRRKADLSVSSILYEPQKPTEAENVKIVATINNFGEGVDANDFEVALLVDGSKIKSQIISVKERSESNVTFIWPAIYGKHNLSLIADSSNSINEYSETNNEAKTNIEVIDITPPPAPKLTVTPADWSTSKTHTIKFDPVSDGSGIGHYEYQIDYGDWIKMGDTQFETPPQEDGVHTVFVRAVDGAGNIGEPGNVSIYIDTTLPNTPRVREWHTGKSWSSHDTPYLSWLDPGDFGSGVTSYIISVDKGSEVNVGNNIIYHEKLQTGIHTFKVRAVDVVGQNSAWSNEITVYIDTIPPATPLVTSPTHPDQNTLYTLNIPVFDWSIPQDDSGISGYYYSVDQEGSTAPDEFSLWTKNNSTEIRNIGGSFGLKDFTGLDDGTWFFHIRAKDKVGNLGGMAHYKINIIKNRPPVINISVPNGGEIWNGVQTIKWDAFDPDGDAILFTLEFINNGTNYFTLVNNTNETQYVWDTTVVPDSDNYLIKVTARDGNSTIDDISSSTFLIDNTRPATAASGANDLWHNSDIGITLVPTDNLAGIKETYYTIYHDGQPLQINSLSTNGQPLITYESGDNKIEFWSIDKAGNEEEHKLVKGLKLDKTKPTITLRSPLDGSTIEELSFIIGFGTSDPKVQGAPSGIKELKALFDNAEVADSQTIDSTTLVGGPHALSISAIDNAGNSELISSKFIVTSPRYLNNESLAKVENVKTGDSSTDRDIDNMVRHLKESLADEFWQSDWRLYGAGSNDKENKSGRKVFDETKDAVRKMQNQIRHSSDSNGNNNDKLPENVVQAYTAAINNLVKADELLAKVALQDASNKAAQTKNKREKDKLENEINKAQQELSQGFAEMKNGNPDKAIDHYKRSWEHSTRSPPSPLEAPAASSKKSEDSKQQQHGNPQQQARNNAPVVKSFAASPKSGSGNTTVVFKGSATDQDGDNLTYTLYYDISDASILERGSIDKKRTKIGEREYIAPLKGSTVYTARLEACDSKQSCDTKDVEITINAKIIKEDKSGGTDNTPGATDTTLPSISVSHNPKNPVVNELITIKAEASDDVALSSIIIYLDSSSVNTCATSPCEYSISYQTEGSHTYYAKAADTSGNVKSSVPPRGQRAMFTVTS